MNRSEWIVCEQTSRWASALRMALAAAGTPHRLRETRQLAELAAELAERPTALAAIDVRRGNFAEALEWLAIARQRFHQARFAALLDRSLSNDADGVRDALNEAGASVVIASPRRLAAVLELGKRHAAATTIAVQSETLTAQLWAGLPWQER